MTKRLGVIRLATILTVLPIVAQAQDVCIGQLMLFGGNYCPQGYFEANGALLPISQYTALFSIYGTMYGGNGQTTFGLPDLRGRAPVGQGQGLGLPNYSQGQLAGANTTSLTTQNLPATPPSVTAYSGGTANENADGSYLASGATTAKIYTKSGTPVKMAPNMISGGGGQPLVTQSPIQAIRWCVAASGIYCPRP